MKPAWLGSPASFVAPVELPLVETDVPVRTHASVKLLFAGWLLRLAAVSAKPQRINARNNF